MNNPDEFLVASALQKGVRNRGDDDARRLGLCLPHDVRGGDVTAGALDAHRVQLVQCLLIEVDHVDGGQQLGRAGLDLRHEHEGDLVEAQQHDVALLSVILDGIRFLRSIATSAIVPVADLHEDCDAVPDQDRREDGSAQERDQNRLQRALVNVSVRHAQGAKDQPELADLPQVHRREGGHARVLAHEPDRQANARQTYRHTHDGDEDAKEEGRWRWDGQHHAHAGEEETQEEVTDVLDLRVEVRAVWEGAQGGAGDQRRELHRQAHEGQDGGGADEEAPSEGQDKHQLDALGGVVEHRWHYELCVAEGERDQKREHAQGLDDANKV
mmetsp:Transcript_103780/g.334580  ORF Transcript_103780/g.334580 Transcript_103780/m.334580 type:complete len:327 (+) Transcript_103780:482-1462(+)